MTPRGAVHGRCSGPFVRLEARLAVRPVAERLRPRVPTPAQCERAVAIEEKPIPIGIHDLDRPGDLVRAVVADLDDDALIHRSIILPPGVVSGPIRRVVPGLASAYAI